jgi:hypothetical protein
VSVSEHEGIYGDFFFGKSALTPTGKGALGVATVTTVATDVEAFVNAHFQRFRERARQELKVSEAQKN